MSSSFSRLRQKHPRFIYHNYTVEWDQDRLRLGSEFEIEPDIFFSPHIYIHNITSERVYDLGEGILNNLAFHLGLMEIPSYWKATCSPQITIRAGALDGDQINWWKDLLLNGLGEFFFTNDIDFTKPDLVDFKVTPLKHSPTLRHTEPITQHRVLVPVGGGKDSPLTLEILKERGYDLGCLVLNPTDAARGIVRVGGCRETIIVERIIDGTLLDLNNQGYLNGHTPISAYIAFLGVACAVLFGYGRVAISNERSSNEGNVRFKGKEVNHQYSKSFDFETRFRQYSRDYVASSIDYFSFLRPLYELQIAKLFSRLPQYFPVFRSCNRGQKTNSWCGECPKCLFVFSALFPFLSESELLNIFHQNLFENEKLTGLGLSLLNVGEHKPFECVGTTEETMVTFHLCIEKLERENRPLPIVLRVVRDRVLSCESNLEQRAKTVLNSWNTQHWVPREAATLLQEKLAR